MFPLFQSKHVLKIFQRAYCEDDFTSCERYKLATSGTMPEPTLLPDGTHTKPPASVKTG